jgi:PAS domain S-box-containing protein
MLIERSTRIIQQVNAATAEMIGRPAHEIVGKICHGFMCPAESTTCPICDLGQQIDRSERILIQANGNTLPILKTVVPITLNGTAYLLESFIDISQRKQAEERLRFHAQLLGSVREAVVASDLEGRIVYWSRGAEKLFGYSSDEVMNRPYRDFAGSLVPPDEETFRREIMANGTWRGEHRQKNRKGEVFWTSSFISLVLDEQGKPSGFIGIDADITDRKQAQKESEQLQLQLAQAHKMESVGRLAGGVAHDFNNMLGAILGHAEIALESVPPGHPLHGDLVEIQKAAKRSADLTRQLLAFARKQTVAPQVIDLNETVAGMLNMLRRLIGENIDLVWAPNPELGRVKVDPSQIDQILANLCVNARDAIAGKGTLTIETARITFDEAECAQHAGFVPGEYAMLSVRDDGCGMDNETQVNLFEPFFTTKGVGQGTGLGLATVYGIVKQNHGFICVESAPGKGSTFQIYLPRHLGVQDSPAGAHAAKPASPGQATVLVVEDEPAILQITRTMLTRLGYQVLGAATPGEAIHLAETHSGAIHLLMTDVVMPEMNGRDLAKNLLSLYPHIKRLFMSGYTADVIAHHGVLHEGVEFIQKPFSMKELADKVREALADSGGS